MLVNSLSNLTDLLLENSLNGIFAYDRELNITLWNPVLEKMCGYNAESVVGKNIYQLFPFFRQSDASQRFSDTLDGKTCSVSLIKYTAESTGKQIFLEAKHVPLKDDLGYVTGGIVFVHDVTNTENARQQLLESEGLYRLVAHNMRNLVILYSFQGEIFWTSPSFYNMLGYKEDELIDRQVFDLVHSEDLKKLNSSKASKEIALGKEVKTELRIRHKKGQFLWFECICKAVAFKNSKVTQVQTTARDITEIKNAQQDALKKERKLSTLISNLNGFVYECENNGSWSVSFLSEGIYALTGYSVDAFTSHKINFPDLIAKEFQEKNWSIVRKSLKEKKKFTLEYKIKTADGTYKWLWEQGQGIFDQQENLVSIEGFITDITERKNAEENLKESENKYRTLTESSGVGIWQLDKNYKTLYLNKAMCNILNIKNKEELGHQTVDAFFTSESMETIRKHRMKRGHNISSTYEAQLITKDGKIRSVIIHGAPLLDSNRKLYSIISTVVDVSEQKIMNEALIKSEERFRALFEKNPVAIGISRNGTTIQVNPTYAKLFGYDSPEELIGTSIVDVIAPSDVEVIKERVAARTRGENVPSSYEATGLKKDGTEFPFQIEVGYFELPEGLASIAHIKDITEAKKAETDLKKSEEKYRSLFESELIGIAISEPSGFVLEANDTLLKMLGYKREEMENRLLNWKEITPQEYFERDMEGVEECLRLGIMKPFEKEFFKKNGERLSVIVGASKIQGEDKGVSFVIDISDLKQSRDELKTINKELNTFLYMASHDLKGPLASVIGLTQIAQAESKDTIALKYLDLIKQCTSKLDKSLMNLMKIMKIKGEAHEKDVIDFQKLLEDVKDSLKEIKGYTKVKITSNVNISSPFYSDWGIINSVIQNLVENSIKYQSSLKEDPFINISISEVGNNVIIEIEDNGKGIDPAIKYKVFDMFYRGNTESKGSGLGLYIVKNALEKINGSIDFKSRAYGGTIFTVVIPRYVNS